MVLVGRMGMVDVQEELMNRQGMQDRFFHGKTMYFLEKQSQH